MTMAIDTYLRRVDLEFDAQQKNLRIVLNSSRQAVLDTWCSGLR